MNIAIAGDSKPQSFNSRLSPYELSVKKAIFTQQKLNTFNGIKQNLVGIYYCSYCCSWC